MEIFLSLCLGLGLAAACGFRIFIPLLIISIAAHTGHLQLATSFAWMGSTPALIVFAFATALEIAGYYVPWLDHFLDTLATPAATVAGTIAAASVFTSMDPMLQWTLAIIAGGGVAGMVQGGSVLARTVSTAFSGGLTNPVIATGELGLSIMTSVLAIALPALAAGFVLMLAFAVAILVWFRLKKNLAAQVQV